MPRTAALRLYLPRELELLLGGFGEAVDFTGVDVGDASLDTAKVVSRRGWVFLLGPRC